MACPCPVPGGRHTRTGLICVRASLDAVRPERAMKRCLVVLLLCCVSAFASAGGGVRVLPQDSGVDVRLRGISAVAADVAWASGAKGTVLRRLAGGRPWRRILVPGGRKRVVEGKRGAGRG